MRNTWSAILFLSALITTIVPVGSAGSLFDFVVIPILIVGSIIKAFLSPSISINFFICIAFLAVLPLAVNIATCHQEDILALGIIARTIALLCAIGILLSDVRSWGHDKAWIIHAIIVFIAFVALASILSKLSGLSITFSTPLISSRSYNGDPHVLGPLMAFAAMFGLRTAASSSYINSFPANIPRPLARTALVSFSLIAFLLSFLTGSRGALLIYSAFAFFFALQYFRQVFYFVLRPILNVRHFIIGLIAVFIASASLAFLLSNSIDEANNMYNPSRVFAIMEILSGEDTSRSTTLSNTIQVVSRPDMHLIPHCEAVDIADNGIAFMYLNHGSLFAASFLGLLIHLYSRLNSPFSKAVLFSTLVFTLIASETIFLPRFFAVVLAIILASDSREPVLR